MPWNNTGHNLYISPVHTWSSVTFSFHHQNFKCASSTNHASYRKEKACSPIISLYMDFIFLNHLMCIQLSSCDKWPVLCIHDGWLFWRQRHSCSRFHLQIPLWDTLADTNSRPYSVSTHQWDFSKPLMIQAFYRHQTTPAVREMWLCFAGFAPAISCLKWDVSMLSTVYWGDQPGPYTTASSNRGGVYIIAHLLATEALARTKLIL